MNKLNTNPYGSSEYEYGIHFPGGYHIINKETAKLNFDKKTRVFRRVVELTAGKRSEYYWRELLEWSE